MVSILSVQYNPKTGYKEENFKRVDEIIGQNFSKKIDLVVLPEFFSTGIIDHNIYSDYTENENDGGSVFAWAKEITKKYNTNLVAGTVIEKNGNRLYNTSFVFNRSGEIVGKYRKIHLYNYVGTEGKVITPGDKPVVVDLDFGKIGINICYDIRYPMHIKNLAKMGAEIVVCPYAWCIEKREYDNEELLKYEEDIFDCLHKVRAYENLVCIVSSNQVGFNANEKLYCIGHSAIFEVCEKSPEVRVVAQVGNEECAICADIDLNNVRKIRKHYPISTID